MSANCTKREFPQRPNNILDNGRLIFQNCKPTYAVSMQTSIYIASTAKGKNFFKKPVLGSLNTIFWVKSFCSFLSNKFEKHDATGIYNVTHHRQPPDQMVDI